MKEQFYNSLAENVASGDRRSLSKAITLVESTKRDHQKEASQLLKQLRANGRSALRLGLSGTPGVGKSTFTETFGMMLIREGLKVAILAVDPSSTRSGGSILGDKTRMPDLSREANAFIRPSPSRSALGGVAARTRSVIELCEGAGFDVIIVETVGVGQSETMVADMTDVFLLLLAPAGGDELQGVKRGIMEKADLIVVNKADGDLKFEATRTASEYASALHLMRNTGTHPEGHPKALTISALENRGIDDVWDAITQIADWRRDTGNATKMRKAQALKRFEIAVQDDLLSRARSRDTLASLWASLEDQIKAGDISPDDAAQHYLDAAFPQDP